MNFILKSSIHLHACVHEYFHHVVLIFMSDTQWAVHIQGPTIQLMHIRGPTIQTYEGPQGPGTMLLKSGTVPEIQGPLRPMGLCMCTPMCSNIHQVSPTFNSDGVLSCIIM